VKPSEIVLGVPPLVGTMGRAEAEFAAALVVLACEANGDRWQAVAWPQITAAAKAALEEGRRPWLTLLSNPFYRPDVWELVKRGFARWEGEPGGPVELTMWGLVAMDRWHRPGGAS
jgi:hypothetical protein